MSKAEENRPNGSVGSEEVQNEKKLLANLGLCVRAGKVIFGVPMICEAMRRSGGAGTALVLEAADSSDGTHKRITDKCKFYQVQHKRLRCGGAQLAAALGKTAHLAAVAVTDPAMSAMIAQYL